jgi:hypothetical protein
LVHVAFAQESKNHLADRDEFAVMRQEKSAKACFALKAESAWGFVGIVCRLLAMASAGTWASVIG